MKLIHHDQSVGQRKRQSGPSESSTCRPVIKDGWLHQRATVMMTAGNRPMHLEHFIDQLRGEQNGRERERVMWSDNIRREVEAWVQWSNQRLSLFVQHTDQRTHWEWRSSEKTTLIGRGVRSAVLLFASLVIRCTRCCSRPYFNDHSLVFAVAPVERAPAPVGGSYVGIGWILFLS